MNLFAYFCAIFKSIIFGSTFFFTGKLTENVDVLDVLALRFLLSFFVLWLLKTARIIKVNVGIKTFLKRNERTPFLKSLLLAALFEPVLYMFFETMGVAQTTGVTAAVIVSLAPIANVVAESFVLKERCSVPVKIFLACGIVGAVYIAVKDGSVGGSDTVIGIIFLVTSVLVGALFSSFSRKSSFHFKPIEISYVACAVGTVVFNTINVARHLISGSILHYFDPYFNLDNLIGFLVLGVLSTIIAGAMTNYALSKLHLSVVAAFGGVSTLVTVLIGVIFGGEQLYYYHFIGFAFILVRMIGVSVISLREELAPVGAQTASAPRKAGKLQNNQTTISDQMQAAETPAFAAEQAKSINDSIHKFETDNPSSE